MKKFYIISLLLVGTFLSGCIGKAQYQVEDMYGVSPHCRKETTVAIYDKDGMHTFPGCADYEFVPMDRGFPDVPNNKYDKKQVVLENLNTRVLAYCRGTDEEIEECVKTLMDACYTPIKDIPHLSAKYDTLKTGTYPTRRWRNGEIIPRW